MEEEEDDKRRPKQWLVKTLINKTLIFILHYTGFELITVDMKGGNDELHSERCFDLGEIRFTQLNWSKDSQGFDGYNRVSLIKCISFLVLWMWRWGSKSGSSWESSWSFGSDVLMLRPSKTCRVGGPPNNVWLVIMWLTCIAVGSNSLYRSSASLDLIELSAMTNQLLHTIAKTIS